MLECKTFELRDRMTFIALAAVRIQPSETRGEMPNEQQSAADAWLLRRCGYPFLEQNVLLCCLDGTGPVRCCPREWGDRTYQIAHQYIVENWSVLESGAVVDVEFILGETKQPKVSERETAGL